jgi:hypothetical protein
LYIDAVLEPVEGAAAWVTRLRTGFDDPRRVVVIRHLEALHGTAAQAACGFNGRRSCRFLVLAACPLPSAADLLRVDPGS